MSLTNGLTPAFVKLVVTGEVVKVAMINDHDDPNKIIIFYIIIWQMSDLINLVMFGIAENWFNQLACSFARLQLANFTIITCSVNKYSSVYILDIWNACYMNYSMYVQRRTLLIRNSVRTTFKYTYIIIWGMHVSWYPFYVKQILRIAKLRKWMSSNISHCKSNSISYIVNVPTKYVCVYYRKILNKYNFREKNNNVK